MHRRHWMAMTIGAACALAAAGPARAGEDPGQRVAITPEEREAVRDWLLHAAAPASMSVRATASSTQAPDWLVAHSGPAAPPPPPDAARLARGERLPVTVYRQGEPLPAELLSRLPPQPRATMLLRFDRRLVRVFRPTRLVLDAVEL